MPDVIFNQNIIVGLIINNQIDMRDDPTLWFYHTPPLTQISCQTGTDPSLGSWFEIAKKSFFDVGILRKILE